MVYSLPVCNVLLALRAGGPLLVSSIVCHCHLS